MGVVIVEFAPAHLDGVLEICRAEGWTSLSADPDRALSLMTGTGAVTLCGLDGQTVVGFAFGFGDGAIDFYLSMLVVADGHRRRGVGRRLIDGLFERTGVARIDLLAEPGSEPFYESLPHRTFRGFRLRPR